MERHTHTHTRWRISLASTRVGTNAQHALPWDTTHTFYLFMPTLRGKKIVWPTREKKKEKFSLLLCL